MSVASKGWLSLVGAVSLATLSACGGGGGGGSGSNPAPSFSVAFQATSLTAKVFQGEVMGSTAFDSPDVEVDASVQANIPAGFSGSTYVRMVDTGQGFGKSSFSVVSHGDGTYSATLTPDVTLAPGTYTGNLSLQFCADQACSTPFTTTGGTLAYTVTVGAALAAQVYVNGTLAGAIQAGRGAPLQVSAPVGAAIEITSNIPVQWNYSTGPNMVVVTTASDSTATDYRATLSLPAVPYGQQIELDAYTLPTTGIAQIVPGVVVTLH